MRDRCYFADCDPVWNPLGDAAKLMIQSVYEKDTLLVVGSFILVTFLQRIMENRKLLERAEMARRGLAETGVWCV